MGTALAGSGEWIRTTDLRVMSPTSYHCSTPRRFTPMGPGRVQTRPWWGDALPPWTEVKMNQSSDRIDQDPADSGRGLRGRAIENPEPSAISTTQLHGLPRFHVWPIDLLV